jgi:sugar phosphate isomerase/epimerase
MQLGIFAKTFAGTTPLPVLGAAKQAGYGAVQYNMASSGLGALPSLIDDGVAHAVRDASAQTGVAIAAVSATYNMIHPDEPARVAGRRAFAAIAAAAPAMGTRLVTVCTGSRDPVDQWRHHPDNAGPDAWRAMCEEFGHLLTIAERHDILIGVEPELANVVSSAGAAARLIETLGAARIRIVLDPANLFEIADSTVRRGLVEEAVDRLHPHLAMVHAKDRFADGQFAPAGRGVIDFEHFFATLHRAGFAGPVITHGLSADEAPGVAMILNAALMRAAA